MKKDITEKLNFNGNPSLVVNGTEIEVNADATTVLKVMGAVGNESEVTPKIIVQTYETIFVEKERKKIEKLKLNMEDFQTLVNEAIGMIAGEVEKPGEQ
ncbi:hypothetical protein NE619_17095 [Anaerovorax odorimutans]|uniref:Phage protein n=1 Tax=Anaerovorax odorimutans TaxID=109327 RepID=A0ABT1RTB3_9FIRM|nr:hypothetical protein [Anaerovorax odorimutans]MCQ4638449.1 hypothetical protein [Anaerovorax odorimutans]